MAAKKKLTFEERLQQVEALIAKMESGEMPLEFTQFGIKLTGIA